MTLSNWLLPCLLLQTVFAQTPPTIPATATTPRPVYRLQTVQTPFGRISDNPATSKYTDYLSLEGLDPRAFDAFVFKVTFSARNTSGAVNSGSTNRVNQQKWCEQSSPHLEARNWNGLAQFYCVSSLPDHNNQNSFYIFLEHRNLQMTNLNDAGCRNKLANQLAEILEVEDTVVEVTVLDPKYDVTKLSWVPSPFYGNYRIALDACKTVKVEVFTVVRMLFLVKTDQDLSDSLQDVVLALHNFLEKLTDLQQVEQGGAIHVENVQVIPFYFYFVKDSPQASVFKSTALNTMELASGLFAVIETLLVPTKYNQRCEISNDPYPVEVVTFEGEVQNVNQQVLAKLQESDETTIKAVETRIRESLQLFVEQLSDSFSYKSATVDYFIIKREKLYVAFHVNLDSYRSDPVPETLTDSSGEPWSTAEMADIKFKGWYMTNKKILCPKANSVKLDVLVPPSRR